MACVEMVTLRERRYKCTTLASDPFRDALSDTLSDTRRSMATRLNDTDPQSPVALQARTDPGIGGPLAIVMGAPQPEPEEPPLPPTPTPGSASIEELLDGITGPRPPPSRRDGAARPSAPPRREGVDSVRAYAPARPAPPSYPTPPLEPAVLSPEPSDAVPPEPSKRPAPERDTLTVPRSMPDPSSVRPVVRRGEEQTVYTGKRAILRNSVTVLLSAVAVTVAMMAIMRWKDAHRPRSASLSPVIVEGALAPTPEAPAATGPAPTIVIVSPPPPAPPAESVAAIPAAAAPAPSASAVPASKRFLGSRRAKLTPPTGSLDDLNREISH